MKLNDETQPLYLEPDALGGRLGAGLLQTRSGTSCPRDKAPNNSILRPIAFTCKSLSSAERRYSNNEREALGILHGLEKFCDNCFAREVSIITDHKPLAAIFKKDVATLSQRIQLILLRIHQYGVRIMYKPGRCMFITGWLSRQNHTENKDTEIPGMQLNIEATQTTTNISDCITMKQLQQANHQMTTYNN